MNNRVLFSVLSILLVTSGYAIGLADLMKSYGELFVGATKDSSASQLTADATKAVAWVTLFEPNIDYQKMDKNLFELVKDRKLVLSCWRKEASADPTVAAKDAIKFDNSFLIPAGGVTKYTGMLASKWFVYDHWVKIRIALPPGEYAFNILFINNAGGSLGGTCDFGEVGEFKGGKEYIVRPVFTNPPG